MSIEAGARCPCCEIGKQRVYKSRNIGLLRKRYLKCSESNCSYRGVEVVRINPTTNKPLLAKDSRTIAGTEVPRGIAFS
jgi:hypothetical protein